MNPQSPSPWSLKSRSRNPLSHRSESTPLQRPAAHYQNLLTITDPDVTPFDIAEDYLHKILIELQDLHDTARRTKATNITTKYTIFTKIAAMVQNVGAYQGTSPRS
jgi:hypothetical protein